MPSKWARSKYVYVALAIRADLLSTGSTFKIAAGLVGSSTPRNELVTSISAHDLVVPCYSPSLAINHEAGMTLQRTSAMLHTW